LTKIAEQQYKRKIKRQQILQRNTRSTYEKYSISRINVEKIIRRKKKEHMKNKIKELEQLNKANENRKFYHAMKNITIEYRARTNAICDAKGHIIKD